MSVYINRHFSVTAKIEDIYLESDGEFITFEQRRQEHHDTKIFPHDSILIRKDDVEELIQKLRKLIKS